MTQVLMWSIGTEASLGAPGVAGKLHFCTDTGRVFRDSGSAWTTTQMVWQGAYSAGTTYQKLDVLTNAGSTFMALTTVTGVTPVDGVNYKILAAKGDTGAQGIQGPAGSGAAPNIKLNNTQVVAGASNFDFSSAFTVTESPTGEGNIGASFGSTSGTIAQGNDSRLSDTRTPTDGTVTNAKVASSAAIDEAKLNLASDAAAATASRRTLGTGAQQGAAGNDGRFSLPRQIAVAGARVNWTNVPSAITEYFGVTAYRTKCDLNTMTEMRCTATVDGGTTVPSGCVLRVQYSTDGSTWNEIHGTLATVNMAVNTAGTKDTGWFTPLAGVKALNIYLRCVAEGGNGATALVVGNVHVYVR